MVWELSSWLCQVGAGAEMCVQNSVNFPTHFGGSPSYFYGVRVAVASQLVSRVLSKVFRSTYFFLRVSTLLKIQMVVEAHGVSENTQNEKQASYRFSKIPTLKR